MIYNELKRIRTERGMSISELARRSGVSRITVSDIESGESNPTVKTIKSICKVLDKSPAEIFFTSNVNQSLHKVKTFK